MSMVSNTGPLIALAKIDQMKLLEQLVGIIHLPPMVHRELLAKVGPESARIDAALASFIHVNARPQISPTLEQAIGHLDAGEQEAIALAYAMGKPVVLDDKLGRKAARQLQVAVTGTAGVLIQAKHAGLILQVRPFLEMLCQQGYWLSPTVVEVATRLAAETS